MYFQGNFVDYCKIAFGEYAYWKGNRVEGNIFDSVFKVFDTKHMFNDTIVTGNRFVRIYHTSFAGQWGDIADAEMMSEDWTVFTISGQCDRVYIFGNAGEATTALKMHSVNNPCDTYINVLGISGKREFEYYNTANAAGSSFFVEDLDYITVDGDSLPGAALYDPSRKTLTFFNKQHIFWQGNLYINNNGTWVKLSND